MRPLGRWFMNRAGGSSCNRGTRAATASSIATSDPFDKGLNTFVSWIVMCESAFADITLGELDQPLTLLRDEVPRLVSGRCARLDVDLVAKDGRPARGARWSTDDGSRRHRNMRNRAEQGRTGRSSPSDGRALSEGRTVARPNRALMEGRTVARPNRLQDLRGRGSPGFAASRGAQLTQPRPRREVRVR
jgi:hypothetical protein